MDIASLLKFLHDESGLTSDDNVPDIVVILTIRTVDSA